MIRSGWLFLYGIICVMAVDLKITKHEGNERSVNLALDTILEFDNKDNVADIKFLDNVQKFIGKVKTVIEKKSMRRHNFISNNNDHLTSFILNVIQILKQFNDTDLEYFFALATDEMKNYHYKGCKFHELTENYELRRHLASKLADIKNTPAAVLRRQLEALVIKIEEEKFNRNEKELIDYINSLYGERSMITFHRILNSLDDYRLQDEKTVDLSKIINKGIRSVLFDYYTELNRNARMALKSKLDEFYKNFMEVSTSIDPDVKDIVTKTTKELTTTQNYVKQYLEFNKYSSNKRWSPDERNYNKHLSSSSLRVPQTFYDIDNVQIYSRELRLHKRQKHVDRFNEQQQLIHSKKSKINMQNPNFRNGQINAKHTISYKTVSKPQFQKENIQKHDPYAYEHSKIDALFQEQTPKRIHPIRSSVVKKYTDAGSVRIEPYLSQNNEPKNYNKRGQLTPKEPSIDESVYENKELSITKTTMNKKRAQGSHSFKTTLKSKLASSMHSIVKDSKLLPVTLHSLILSLEPHLDDKENIKSTEEKLQNHKFIPHSEKSRHNLGRIQEKYKKSGRIPTENTLNYEKSVNHEVKNQLQNFELNQKVDKYKNKYRNGKPQTSKRSTWPSIETNSVEFIAFEDDFGGIDLEKQKTKSTIETTPVKSLNSVSNPKRIKNNRLTFMTLYPEFIHKWTKLKSQTTSKQHAQNFNTKEKVRYKNRESTTPRKLIKPQIPFMDIAPHIPKGIKKIISSKHSTRPENLNVVIKSRNKHPKDKDTDDYEDPKTFTKKSQQLTHGIKKKAFDSIDSKEKVSSKESMENMPLRTFYRRNMNNITRDGLFIDVNVLTHTQDPGKIRKSFETPMHNKNIDNYVNGKPIKKEINFDSMNYEETKFQNKAEIDNESNDSKLDNNGRKQTDIKNIVLQGSRNLEKDQYYSDTNKEFTKNVENSHYDNQSNQVFIDLQHTNTEDLNGGEVKNKMNYFSSTETRARKNQENLPITSLDQTTRSPTTEKYTPKQFSNIDKNFDAMDSAHRRELYDTYRATPRKKKIYFSYSNNEINNPDWKLNNVAQKITNKNAVASSDDNIKYRSIKNLKSYDKENNNYNRQNASVLSNLNSNRDKIEINRYPDKFINDYSTPVLETIGTKSNERIYQENTKEIKIEKHSYNIIDKDKYSGNFTDDGAVIYKSNKIFDSETNEYKNSKATTKISQQNNEKNTDQINIKDSIQIQDQSTKRTYEIERSATIKFRAEEESSNIEKPQLQLQTDNNNFKSSVAITTTDKITTSTIDFLHKNETGTNAKDIHIIIKNVDDESESRVNTPINEISQGNIDGEKINKSIQGIVSSTPQTLDGTKNVVSNLTDVQIATNYIFKQLNVTKSSN